MMIARKSRMKTSAAFPNSQSRRTVSAVAVRIGAKRKRDETAATVGTALKTALRVWCESGASPALLLVFLDLELDRARRLAGHRLAGAELAARLRRAGAELVRPGGRAGRQHPHLLLESEELHVG